MELAVYFKTVLQKLLPGISEVLYTAEGFGGVLLCLTQNVSILNSSFYQNGNKFAGVGYFIPLQQNFLSEILIENNIFSENHAGDNAGVLLLSKNYLVLKCVVRKNVFESNVGKSIYLFF